MNIHEYQAKKLFRSFGIPVPVGGVARTSEEVVQQAAKLRAGTLVVKAQIHAGGRGKAGGVLTADGPEGARRHAERLLGNVLVTRQTGPEGRVVRSVLIEEGQNIEHEYYVAVTLDRATRRPVILVSPDGGMDIEEVAANTPGHLFKLGVDPLWGLRDYEARCLAAFLGFSGKRLHFCAGILQKLFTLYQSCDAALVEINPLILTTEGNLLALDAKLNLEENALFRHPDLKALEDPEERDPLEVQAERHGLNYIRLNGNIGVMVNGAGLAMATMDLIKQAGGEPANFLDVGGGADAGKIAAGFRIIMSDPKVEAIFVNIFGGILRCDLLAEGVVMATRETDVSVPLIVRLQGTNAEEGQRILQESGLLFTVAKDLHAAAKHIAGVGYHEHSRQ